MQDNTTITPATITDAALLSELAITTFRETFDEHNKPEDMDRYVAEEMNMSRLAGELADSANEFFIARVGSAAAGYAKVRTGILPGGLSGHSPLEIERLYVLSSYHGQRVGAALMGHCLALARARGCDTVWLGVWEHNHKAIAFYRKWGFSVFGDHIFTLGSDDQTDLLMQLPL